MADYFGSISALYGAGNFVLSKVNLCVFKIIVLKRYFGAVFFSVGYDTTYGIMRVTLFQLSKTSLYVTNIT